MWQRDLRLAATLLVLVAPATRAQYVPPQANRQGQISAAGNLPAARTQAYAASPAPAVAGYVPPPAPYYPPYYGGYSVYPDVMGGYLNGVAAVTNANAQYQVTIQQARLAQTQADMAKLDLRRRIRDEKEYERMMMPNPEQVRRADIAASLDRARHDPPVTEIWSGQALNDLLQADQGFHRVGLYGPAVPVPPDVLARIRVNTGTSRGSVGALNDGKPLQWPFPLRGERFTSDRQKVDRLVAELVGQAQSASGVDADTLRLAQRAVRDLGETLRAAVADLTPDDYIASRRFLTQLTEGLRVLEQPDAGNYFKQWTPRGRSVPELIDEMTRQSLRFAPAVNGDEPYYTALYQAMITYDTALVRAAGSANLRAAAPPQSVPPQR
jgi:hypothetical protein